MRFELGYLYLVMVIWFCVLVWLCCLCGVGWFIVCGVRWMKFYEKFVNDVE